MFFHRHSPFLWFMWQDTIQNPLLSSQLYHNDGNTHKTTNDIRIFFLFLFVFFSFEFMTVGWLLVQSSLFKDFSSFAFAVLLCRQSPFILGRHYIPFLSKPSRTKKNIKLSYNSYSGYRLENTVYIGVGLYAVKSFKKQFILTNFFSFHFVLWRVKFLCIWVFCIRSNKQIENNKKKNFFSLK